MDLIVSCGAEGLKISLTKQERRKNATYTSEFAVIEFIQAVGIRAEKYLLKHLL